MRVVLGPLLAVWLVAWLGPGCDAPRAPRKPDARSLDGPDARGRDGPDARSLDALLDGRRDGIRDGLADVRRRDPCTGTGCACTRLKDVCSIACGTRSVMCVAGPNGLSCTCTNSTATTPPTACRSTPAASSLGTTPAIDACSVLWYRADCCP